MAQKLTGKVALVTGASSGIGEATALALAAEGAAVAVSARREDRLQDLVKRITDNGGKAYPIVSDVTEEAQANEIVQKTKSELGRVDILVNNAGLMLLGMIEGANTDDWRRMINTNVLGLMYATHAVIPIMKEQNSGHIVNISSVAGRTARVGRGVYNASKWGVVAFSDESHHRCFCKKEHRRFCKGHDTTRKRGYCSSDSLCSHPTCPRRRKRNPDPSNRTRALIIKKSRLLRGTTQQP